MKNNDRCCIYIQVMEMARDNKRRESIRLQSFDYNSAGAYFLTICTENRQSVLSTVVGGDVPYETALCGVSVCFHIQAFLQ